MKRFFSLVAVLIFGSTYGQNLTGFTDYRDYFYVFDNGVSHQKEFQKIKDHKVGATCLAYVDNLGKFKIYHDGETKEIERYNIGNYAATEHLVVYKVDHELLVFDAGKIKSLVYYPAFYGVGDSIVAFLDRASSYLTVYYQGNIFPIADGLLAAPMKSLSVGDNTVAFVDIQDRLNLFYRGRIVELIYSPRSFRVSLNTAAFIDAMSGEFGIFHRGTIYDVETFEPISYKLGDDLVAYVDQSGSFKVFYEGEVLEISSFQPDFYKVIDDLVIYGENSFFKVVYKGEEHTLENYIPQSFYADQATLAYIDQFGYLQCFYKGKRHSLSDEAVMEVMVAGNTVAYKVGLNTNKIFWNGQIY